MSSWCVAIAPPGAPEEAAALAARLSRARGWRPEAITGGLAVLTRGPAAVRALRDGNGMLVGHAFDRSGAKVDAPAWPAGEAGERFIARYWGAYVAFRTGADAIEVVRDASAMAPCYLVRVGAAWLATNTPRLVTDAGLIEIAIDWPVVIASLVNHDARGERTALVGVEELLPGTSALLRPGGVERQRLWDPWDFVPQRRCPPPDPDALGAAIDRAAAAWARLYRRPLIEISGGFDSAVVAAALAPHVERVQLITFAAGPGDPNELGYAKAVARHLGAALEIARPEVAAVDLLRSHAQDLPRPNARAFTQAADALSEAHARSIGADAFASGGGGDDLFGYRRSIAPAIDRLRLEGTSPGVIRSLSDIARANQATFWGALARFARRLAARPAAFAPRPDTRLLAPDRWVADPIAHENPCAKRLPGAAAHVRAVATLPNHLEGHRRATFAPVLFPLLSQPLVEYCLGVPSWHWYQGGINRALARRAFRDRLPPSVLERRSKGAFDGFCARLLEHNRTLVAELLLEGALARQGILDTGAVAVALKNPAPTGELVMRLLALVDVEAWLASWPAGTRPAPPARANGHIDRASRAPDPSAR